MLGKKLLSHFYRKIFIPMPKKEEEFYTVYVWYGAFKYEMASDFTSCIKMLTIRMLCWHFKQCLGSSQYSFSGIHKRWWLPSINHYQNYITFWIQAQKRTEERHTWSVPNVWQLSCIGVWEDQESNSLHSKYFLLGKHSAKEIRNTEKKSLESSFMVIEKWKLKKKKP